MATSSDPGGALFSRTLPSGLHLTVVPRAGHPGQIAITLGHLSAVGSSTKAAVAPYARLATPGISGLVAVTGATMTDLGAGRAVIVAVVHTSPAVEGLRLTASPGDGTAGPADPMTPVRGLAVLAVTVSQVRWGSPGLLRRPAAMAATGTPGKLLPTPSRFSLAVTGTGGKLLSTLVGQGAVERPLVCPDKPNTVSATTTSITFGRAAATTTGPGPTHSAAGTRGSSSTVAGEPATTATAPGRAAGTTGPAGSSTGNAPIAPRSRPPAPDSPWPPRPRRPLTWPPGSGGAWPPPGPAPGAAPAR